MSTRQVVVTIVVALVGSGIWPFFQFLLNRKPAVEQQGAQTTNITVQGAETTVAVLMRTLERAERREAVLEQRLAEREDKIAELEERMQQLADKLGMVQVELDDARTQLAQLRRS